MGDSKLNAFPAFPKKDELDRTQIVMCSPPLPSPPLPSAHSLHPQVERVNHLQVTQSLSQQLRLLGLNFLFLLTYPTPNAPPTLDPCPFPVL